MFTGAFALFIIILLVICLFQILRANSNSYDPTTSKHKYSSSHKIEILFEGDGEDIIVSASNEKAAKIGLLKELEKRSKTPQSFREANNIYNHFEFQLDECQRKGYHLDTGHYNSVLAATKTKCGELSSSEYQERLSKLFDKYIYRHYPTNEKIQTATRKCTRLCREYIDAAYQYGTQSMAYRYLGNALKGKYPPIPFKNSPECDRAISLRIYENHQKATEIETISEKMLKYLSKHKRIKRIALLQRTFPDDDSIQVKSCYEMLLKQGLLKEVRQGNGPYYVYLNK